MFRLLGLVPGSTFTLDLVAAMLRWDRDAAEHALDRLCHAQLVRSVDDERCSLHDLVRLFSHERLAAEEPERGSEEALERALRWYLESARGAARQLRRPGGGELSVLYPHERTSAAVQTALGTSSLSGATWPRG